jgi:hypothetical protein
MGGVDRDQRRALPGQMAHSLIPIVVGYIFAHYLSYLVERGQQAVIVLADPFGRGWNLLGLAHMHVAYVLSTNPGARRHQGDMRGHRAYRGGDRGP